MKTATITLHALENAGSVLQAYGLQHFLQKNGIENEIIDYKPAYLYHGGHVLRSFVKRLVYFRSVRTQTKRYRQFCRENLRTTSRHYTDADQLRAEPPAADCYITGSDQLWNTQHPCGKDTAFYLDFVKDKKRLAYAVSLGRTVIPPDNLEMVRRYVKDYAWVSVREKSSVGQLAPFVDCELDYVCDPVLLNESGDYERFIGKRLIEEPYELVYLAQNVDREEMDRIVSQVARGGRAKVVLVGSFIKRCSCDMHIRSLCPNDFLNYIYYADDVISNSFHGTVFSLMFRKQFVSLLPPENGARIKELLELVGLQEHGIEKGGPLPARITEDEYARVQSVLSEFSRSSGERLLSHLRSIDRDTAIRSEGPNGGKI